jgi:hypothetical protein
VPRRSEQLLLNNTLSEPPGQRQRRCHPQARQRDRRLPPRFSLPSQMLSRRSQAPQRLAWTCPRLRRGRPRCARRVCRTVSLIRQSGILDRPHIAFAPNSAAATELPRVERVTSHRGCAAMAGESIAFRRHGQQTPARPHRRRCDLRRQGRPGRGRHHQGGAAWAGKRRAQSQARPPTDAEGNTRKDSVASAAGSHRENRLFG